MIDNIKDIIKLLNSDIQSSHFLEFPSGNVLDVLHANYYGLNYVATMEGSSSRDHEWYKTKTIVYGVYRRGKRVGDIMSEMVTKIYSESMNYTDIEHQPHFVECREEIVRVPVTVYIETKGDEHNG